MAPLDFLSRLIDHFTRKDPPIIAPSTAAVLSITYTLIYVIPFYLSSKTRPSQHLSRDSPTVIRARIRSVTLSCILTGVGTTYVGFQYGHLQISELAHVMGWWPIDLLDLLKSTALVMILFAGPLFERGVVEGEWRTWVRPSTYVDAFSYAIVWRTYVAVCRHRKPVPQKYLYMLISLQGPISEEFVWRSMIIPLHLFAKIPVNQIIFVTPLYFGIAHVHHCYEFKLTHPDTPLLPAILRSLFQFAFTSVFGFYAAFIFLRTGSLPVAIFTHAFCNWMGLPRFWGRVQPLNLRTSSDATEKDRLPPRIDPTSNAKMSILWTLSYYTILVAGAYGFYLNLFRLTDSQNSLIPTS